MTGIMCLNDGYCSLSVADKHQVVALKPEARKSGVSNHGVRESVQQLIEAVKPLQVKTVDLLVDLSSETISSKAMPNISPSMQGLWRKNQIRINHKTLYMCKNKIAAMELHGEAAAHIFATGYADKQPIKSILVALLELGVVVNKIVNLSQIIVGSIGNSRMDWELLVAKKSANVYRLVCTKAGLILLSRELTIISDDADQLSNDLKTECQIIRQHLITKNILQNEDMQQANVLVTLNGDLTENKWIPLDELDRLADNKNLKKSKPLEYFNSWLKLYAQVEGLYSKHTHVAHKCLFILRESRFILFYLLVIVIFCTGILLYQHRQAENIYVSNVSQLHTLSEQTQLNLAGLKQKSIATDKASEYLLPAIEFSQTQSKLRHHSPESVIKDLGEIIGRYPGLYVDNMHWKALKTTQDSYDVTQVFSAESIVINGGLINKKPSAISLENPLQSLLDEIAGNGIYRIANYDWHYTDRGEFNYSLEIYQKEK